MENPTLSGTRRAINHIARTILGNLEHQHDWTSLELRDSPDQPRPLIRGLPPKRLYLHPDDQVAALTHERSTGAKLSQSPEPEWVLPIHLAEQWSLASFAAVFDSIDDKPGVRAKRILVAALHNDSTVVYYLMHQGMVKPRQN
ncbi:hypothetical protein G6O67_001409 [Ophiocordyceps sinensis]|uniref:tRNA-splicing endonuclease subunit Sen15 domain-containing protein n=2 Tax=Ophiocordyceps sinensis TaxID=72228 RepID=A0A8H4PXC7_9HYPO|nr:tRNA-splicing endonuclease subunit Sen15 [Ophiocordyceps sinensis CO18]KAF4512244.1 hypothetical protein G6O67_001409 [Ophiocordyceps sinensis]